MFAMFHMNSIFLQPYSEHLKLLHDPVHFIQIILKWNLAMTDMISPHILFSGTWFMITCLILHQTKENIVVGEH